MKTRNTGRMAVAILGIAVLALAGCNSGGSSASSSNAGLAVASAADFAAAADWIPTIADLRSQVQMTDTQAASVDAALTNWRTAVADRGQRMHDGGRPDFKAAGGHFPPVATFLSEAGKTLQADQFVALAGYLKTIRDQHKSEMGQMRQQAGGMMADRMVRQLDLSPDQEKQVQQILQEFHTARMQAFQAHPGVPPDSAEVSRVRAELLSRLGSVLTPDQLEKFKSFQEKRQHRWEANKGDRRNTAIDQGVESLQGVLQLSEGQTTQIRQILASIPPPAPHGGGGPMMGGFRGGMMPWGGPLLKAQSQIREVLSPDQARRFDAVLELLPGRPANP
ncbi:MAG: hypothetical protein HZB43_04365 [candidate division Zixibacteria bacterium]|nr:hypothetical protein [candidate division Zixibacteria bacterium]